MSGARVVWAIFGNDLRGLTVEDLELVGALQVRVPTLFPHPA